jgi:hypothetical protein
MRRVYQVQARWDSEGGVWVAESEDVPGLVVHGVATPADEGGSDRRLHSPRAG